MPPMNTINVLPRDLVFGRLLPCLCFHGKSTKLVVKDISGKKEVLYRPIVNILLLVNRLISYTSYLSF